MRLATLVLGLAALPLFAAEPAVRPPDGRSDFDLRVEALLARGEVVENDELGAGTTHARRLLLKDAAGVEARAAFKTVDVETEGISRNSRVERNFTDRYVYEVAAYRLDRLFGIGLAPPAVVREIGGEKGAVVYWIEDAITAKDAIARGLAPKDPEAFRRRYGALGVLDGLIFNIDRNPENILIVPAEDVVYAIDHTRSFRLDHALSPFVVDWTLPIPDAVAERLRTVTDDAIRATLAGLVSKQQVDAVVARRKLIVKKLHL